MKATAADVARGMTVGKYALLQEQAERMRAVYEREAEGGKRKAERDACIRLGRPEYRSLRHAIWKETLYERARRREAWQAFVDAGMRRRCEERQRKKDEHQAWLEAWCPVEETPLVEIPVFLLPGF